MSSQVPTLHTQKNSPPLVPGAGSLRRRQNMNHPGALVQGSSPWIETQQKTLNLSFLEVVQLQLTELTDSQNEKVAGRCVLKKTNRERNTEF